MHGEIAHIRASVPEAIEGETLQRITRLGGVITNLERESESRTAIRATITRLSIDDFRSWLRDYSNGQGLVSED